MNEVSQVAVAAYARAFASAPTCVAFAPGRAEILGNHTDQSGGLVLSVAIDRGVAVAAGRIPGFAKSIEVWSEPFQEKVAFPLEEHAPSRGGRGDATPAVVRELDRAGVRLKGTRLAIASSLPAGTGTSFAGAMELAIAESFFELYGGRPRDPLDEAKLCQRAAAAATGIPCGILDAFAARFGKKGHVLLLDCATLRYQQVPFGREDVRVVLVDSGETDEVSGGKSAELRRSFESAVSRCREALSAEIRFLRDVSLADFQRVADELEPEDRPRAEHVIRENDRVLRGFAAVKSRFHEELLRLMVASHASSRDLLGNSTPALDHLVETASRLPGFLGGKIAGGSFGSSTVNLVEEGSVEEFQASISASFQERFARVPGFIVTGIGDGARVESPT